MLPQRFFSWPREKTARRNAQSSNTDIKNLQAIFDDDFLTALRFGFNDVQSTEILAGVIFDRTSNARFFNIEASRRLGDSFTLDLEVRLFTGAPQTDPAFFFARRIMSGHSSITIFKCRLG